MLSRTRGLVVSMVVLAACSDDATTDAGDEIGDSSTTGEGDGDGDPTGVPEDCYEEDVSCDDGWPTPMLACPGKDAVCDPLSYAADDSFDAEQTATLECILTGLRDRTPGVYLVEDTDAVAPRAIAIQVLANGNALIAFKTASIGCSQTETVEGLQSMDFLQGCLDGALDWQTVEDCVFEAGTGCAFYEGDPCGN